MKTETNTLQKQQLKLDTLNQKLNGAMMASLKAIHSATSPDSIEEEDLKRQRKGQEILGRLLSPPYWIQLGALFPGWDAHGLGPAGAWT